MRCQDKNEGHVIGNRRKVADNLTDMCSSVYQRTELVSDKLGYLAGEISNLGVEDMT